ncbi:hypothetical protein ACLMJK_002839 [Lecanora helva]
MSQHEAEVDAQGEEYGNALQAGAYERNLNTVKLLLEHGADVSIQLRLANRLSLLHVGTVSSNLAILKILCDAGASIHLNSQDNSGLTSPHVAVDRGNVTIARFLLNIGASPDKADFGDINPFQMAIRNQDCDMVFLLYPKTTVGLSSIDASDWRRFRNASKCTIEMVKTSSLNFLPEILIS